MRFCRFPALPTLPAPSSRLLQAYQRADDEAVDEGISGIPSWREELWSLSGKAVQLASETGAFDDLRLVLPSSEYAYMIAF